MMLIDGNPTGDIPATDRGLNYGDGLFETMRVHGGMVPLLERHLARLRAGCARIGLAYPGDAAIGADIARITGVAPGDALLRLVLTRGDGGRGYAPPAAASPRRIVARYPLPADVAGPLVVGLCATRLGSSAVLSGLKHLGRLEQVLAAAEVVEAGWDEGLMLDGDGHIIEGTRHNLFYVREGRLCTPSLSGHGVAGVMRQLVLEVLAARGTPGIEAPLRYHDRHEITEMFMCNAVAGVRPVGRLEGRALGAGRVVETLRAPLAAAGARWLA